MPSIKIPETAYPVLQNLIELSSTDFRALVDALSEAKPALEQSDFSRHVTERLAQIDESIAQSLVSEIFNMSAAMAMMDLRSEEFISAVLKAVSSGKTKRLALSEDQKGILRDRLSNILSGRKGLDITTKAAGVMLDQHRTFYSAKILTDVRPVFDEEAKLVDAAVIVHNLRIHYGQDGDHKDFYVALDKSDIEELRQALERADAKAKTLEGVLKRSGVSYLDAEE